MKLPITQFFGKICIKHPKNKGIRNKCTNRCILCGAERRRIFIANNPPRRYGKLCDKHLELKGLRVRSYCLGCKKENASKNAKISGYSLRKRIRTKKEVMDALGHKCKLCGITDIDVLTVDHIYGGGTAERKAMAKGKNYRGSASNCYRRIRREGVPLSKYRCLCFNCNIKAFIYFKQVGKVLRRKIKYA